MDAYSRPLDSVPEFSAVSATRHECALEQVFQCSSFIKWVESWELSE
jgi:hypothetical protein